MSTTTSAPPPTPTFTPAPARTRRGLPTWFGAWEISLATLVAAAIVAATIATPFFATGQNFAITAAGAIGLALMVVPMTLLMISGEIDLSVASMFGLAGVVFGISVEAGIPLPAAVVIGLVLGAVGGLLNGWLTVAFGLPSLVVTVGTLGIFRGAAYVLLESRSISVLPPEWTQFTQTNVYGTYIPYTFIVFVVIAGAAAVLLHRGTFGRKVFAVGSSATVSRFSGIRVKRVKVALFIFSGTTAALAGMLFTGYVSTARANNGTGLELSVIAIVLIGGVSMFGGKGSFAGVLLALLLVTSLTSWMNLSFVPSNVQNTVVGALMIAAVVIPAIAARVGSRRRSTF